MDFAVAAHEILLRWNDFRGLLAAAEVAVASGSTK